MFHVRPIRLLALLGVFVLVGGVAAAKSKGSSQSRRTHAVHGHTTKTGKHVQSSKRATAGTSNAPSKKKKPTH
jgi:hypothetical protein